ncbi:MAG: hypothetical protein KAR79_01295, partial [Simkaniaceae bacterium]|nr:hypothetical protein [Simkaniaceae bacterium]
PKLPEGFGKIKEREPFPKEMTHCIEGKTMGSMRFFRVYRLIQRCWIRESLVAKNWTQVAGGLSHSFFGIYAAKPPTSKAL